MIVETYSRIFDILDYRVARYPSSNTLNRREDKKNWTSYSSANIKEMSDKVSRGLLGLGLKPGDRIAIISTSNRPEWHWVDFGAQHAGIINVPIYPTISPLEYEYILNDAEVQYVFVSDRLLWRKINQVRDKVPSLKEIYSFEQIDETPNYRNILRDADGELDKQIAEIKNNIQPGDLATIIYTSGTTGNPKGVMLSHHNIVSNTKSCLKWVPLLPGDVVLSFLPVCHVFERTLIYTYYVAGANIYFADGLETISEHFPDIRPHWFSTVPRLLEKVYEKIIKKGQALEGFQKKVFFWALELAQKQELGPLDLPGFLVADALVFKKWREALGGRIKAIISGSAPLQPRLATVFTNAGVPIMEGYGLTETAPVLSVNPADRKKIIAGTVGPILPDIQVKLAEDGEILVKGPNVMMGYYKMPEETKKVFTEDGWFLTGDIGEWVNGTYLKITDRKKELFKTSGGKYVAPAPIENKLKESLLIEQVALVGDGRKFIGALIVPNFDNLKEWCSENGIPYESKEKAVQDKAIHDEFMRIVNEANVNFGKVEQVKMIRLLPEEFTMEAGELTPTMKLKRKVIKEKYADIIESFFRS